MSHYEMADGMADTPHGDPMSRRDYRTGSLYQRASDDRWLGTIEAGLTPDGNRRRVTVSAKTKAEAKRKLRDKRLELEREGRRTVKRTTSVARWSEVWLANIQTKVRPSAYETDRAAVKAIIGAIGSVPLSDLSPADVRAVAARLRREGKSTSTALRYHGSLIRMLKAASLEGYAIPPNVLLTEPPTAAAHDRQSLSLSDALKALKVVADRPDGSRWALAFLQGLRQAEALGLTRSAVDLDRGTLTISWQLKTLRYIDRNNPSLGFQMPDGYEARHLTGAYHLVRPKSKAGWRVQPLVPWAHSALGSWLEESPANEHDLVFPGRLRKGTVWPRNAASDRDEWDDIQHEAKIQHPSGRLYVPHEIRNTTATLLMELRVPESVRIAIMGHSNIAVTQGYEHVDLEEARRALQSVADRLQLS